MKKRKLYYTDKGYSYIKVNKQDCIDWGGLAICDNCNEIMEGEIYLVYILGRALCEKCFKEWCRDSRKYEEDLKLQKANHIRWYKNYGFNVLED